MHNLSTHRKHTTDLSHFLLRKFMEGQVIEHSLFMHVTLGKCHKLTYLWFKLVVD